MNHDAKERMAKNNYSCVIIIRKTAIFLGVCMGRAYVPADAEKQRSLFHLGICILEGVASHTESW